MSWATLRPLIKEILEDTVGDDAQVHDYVRHTTHWADFFKRHTKKGRVSTWEFTRTAMQATQDAVGSRVAVGCVYRQTHQVQIIGRASLSERPKEGTENEFHDLVDEVVNAFRANTMLSGRLLVPNPPQIQSIGHQSYGGVLVHQAVITLAAVERVGAP